MGRDRGILAELLRPLVTGVTYFLLAHFSLSASMGLHGMATMWPPSGLLLGVLLLNRRDRWPGLILACAAASAAANYMAHSDPLLTAGFTVANMIESVLVIRLLGKEARQFGAFGEPHRIIRFAASVIAGGLTSAAIATYFVGGCSFGVFVSWATTVILGMLIVTPIIVTTAHYMNRRRRPVSRAEILSSVIALGLVGTVTMLVFTQATYPLLFVPLAAVIMVTYLFGPPGAAASVFVIAVIGSIATTNGLGPIPALEGDRYINVLFFQFFLGVALLSSFPLAALLAQRANNLADLEHSNRMLEMAERAAHVGHWRVDLRTNKLVWSAEVYRIHGYDSAYQPTVPAAIQAYHRDDRKRVLACLKETADTGVPFKFDARLVRKDGSIRHISSSGEMERNPVTGQPAAVVGMFMDVTDRVNSLSQLELARKAAEVEARNAAILAETDQLTGLANRRKILEDLRGEIARAEAFGEPLAIAVLDVDHFKNINDTLGHAAGDEVLTRLGQIFTRSLRSSDRVGRVGGEEFVLVLPGMTADTATPLAERLRAEIADLEWPEAGLDQVTVSIGIAGHSRGLDDRALMLAADLALYSAKRDGRNLLRVAA
ncbi:MAG: diguanylate cyclase [Allopontixanthobacter sediminis]